MVDLCVDLCLHLRLVCGYLWISDTFIKRLELLLDHNVDDFVDNFSH